MASEDGTPMLGVVSSDGKLAEMPANDTVTNKSGITPSIQEIPNGNHKDVPQELVTTMQTMFGKHPGYRTTHAKGLLVEGVFEPTEEAKKYTMAPHFNSPSTKITARFSVGGGLPYINDSNDQATPKGIAIRFHINGEDNMDGPDLISHSYNGFATRTGEEFLAFLQGVIRSSSGKPEDVAAFQKFLLEHPSALAFVKSKKPNPVSYATLTYYQVNTHVLINEHGNKTYVRYRLVPAEGDHLLSDDESKAAPRDYLLNDLTTRLPEKPIVFTLQAHIADADDVVDDATILYKSQTFVPLGKVTIQKVAENNKEKQKMIAFNPVPSGVKGIEPSNDPLIDMRWGVYHISGKQHQEEEQKE